MVGDLTSAWLTESPVGYSGLPFKLAGPKRLMPAGGIGMEKDTTGSP
jgi:hypothetical protein